MQEKGNKIFYIIIAVCMTLVIALCSFLIYRHNKNEITDAIKFKNEYESLNDIETGTKDYKYPSVNIDEDNPIVYQSPKDILNVLGTEEAIIYFGYASCPWCRNVVETMLEVAKENGVNKIYYVDIKDIRDAYTFNGTIPPTKTKNGVEAYYKILDFFGKNLEEYYVLDSDGNQYDTGVTRLYAPTIAHVKDKKVESMHVSTVDSHENPYEKLNEEQRKELYEALKKVVQLSDGFCGETAC